MTSAQRNSWNSANTGCSARLCMAIHDYTAIRDISYQIDLYSFREWTLTLWSIRNKPSNFSLFSSQIFITINENCSSNCSSDCIFVKMSQVVKNAVNIAYMYDVFFENINNLTQHSNRTNVLNRQCLNVIVKKKSSSMTVSCNKDVTLFMRCLCHDWQRIVCHTVISWRLIIYQNSLFIARAAVNNYVSCCCFLVLHVM